ncbi:CELP0028 Effector like protein [Blumeria hordei DH14]|uniref:CELP0028 Effector like protein n=1 Tax=Blumeria graminis f. sp. hordei (strain DH14) TaxID=546991 RepID=N1J946_BLUG1|nr:CELP0028 Effector like protein [Blumeria hordei DH14]
MHFYTFLSAGMTIAAALAAMIPEAAIDTKETLELPSILSVIPLQNLTQDDVIIYGLHNQVKVISRSELQSIMGDIPIATEEQHNKNLTSLVPDFTETEPCRTIAKRCPKETVWSMNPVEVFLNWDVPVSNVVLAPPSNSVSLNINQGFSIGNSIKTSVSTNIKAIKNFLSSSFSVGFSKQWTTAYSAGYRFSIPPGKYGVIVSNPLTTRHSGFMDVGCIGQAERTEFLSDTYQGKDFSDMSWVEGVIGLCVSDSYPVKRCLGSGMIQ